MFKIKFSSNRADDTTAQPLSALELADLKGQLAAIYKSQAVIEFALDGTILAANDNFLQAVGYTLDEIKGKHHRILVDATYAASPEYPIYYPEL